MTKEQTLTGSIWLLEWKGDHAGGFLVIIAGLNLEMRQREYKEVLHILVM